MTFNASSSDTLSTDIVREAIRWRIRLESGAATDERAAYDHWRQADPRHELAWQRLSSMESAFHSVAAQAPALGRDTLVKTDIERQRVSRRQALGILGGSTLGIVCSGLLLNEQGYWHRWNADHATTLGERSQFRLPNQAHAWLNTDSAIQLASLGHSLQVQLTRGEMLLETEAHLTPLAVTFPQADIRVQQGRFLVRREKGHAIVQVLTGRALVKPRHAASAFSMQSGDLYRVDGNTGSPIDSQHFEYSAWADGVLAAYSMPLKALLAEVSRYRAGILRCAPELDNTLISGTYQLRNPEMILQALARSANARVQYRTRLWTEILPLTS